MLAETDRELIRNWNRTDSEYPRDLCIHEVFERQAAKTPDATALVLHSVRWTYGELNARANRIAAHLRDAGVVRDSLVAVLMDRSLETIAVLLGILKAGGAYAPLDPKDPPARIQTLLADLHPVAVLTEPAFASLVSDIQAPVIESLSIAGSVEANLRNISSPDGLAYVMFTSGSTGVPKGAMVEHRSVVRLVKNTNYAVFDDKQVFLLLAPLPFDASTLEIWAPLLNGAVLAIMPPGLPSLGDIAAALREHSVTALWLTAGLFHAMVDQQLEALAQLQQLTSGGDVLSPAHVRRVLDAAPGIRLMNGYGPTEGTVFTTCYTIPQDHPADMPIPIGKPIANTTVYVLDEEGRLVAPGETGELWTGGDGVARGYLNRPELTAEKFSSDPFSFRQGARLYRTGDLARFRADGVVEFLGRADKQVKLRGFRVELGEIEIALNQHGEIGQSAVAMKDGRSEQKSLIAWVVPREGKKPAAADLRAFLAGKLPAYMIPAQFVTVDRLPLNGNGKVDRRALAQRKEEAPAAGMPKSEVERIVTEVWEQAFAVSAPDPDATFFDLGGNSLQLLQAQGYLEARLHVRIAVSDLFRYPSVRSLADFLAERDGNPEPSTVTPEVRSTAREIAIVGLAGRFPGAKNVREFWENLKNGVESITRFTEDEAEARKGPGTVKVRPILDNVDKFDASFFGILPKEAEMMDPQHRVFLECSSDALDDAGCDPSRYRGRVGVFAGCTTTNTYFLRHICTSREFLEDYVTGYQIDNLPTTVATSPDFLCSRVSYKLNLTGPSITVATACSTSLVAITQACESLIGGQCDMALAGGVSITLPQMRGYTASDGGLASVDGHCRAFDANARGTVFGSGCAVVALKRLQDALAEGDSIYAVIKGYGLNNDGASKVSFAAPGVAGQAAAIRKAHEMSGIDPGTITYVETHGTATPLGDPIEIAGLTEAFRARTDKKQFCAIGTAKTNVGHLDAAAGATAIVKTALSIKHGMLPGILHFHEPNPRIDFANSPFYVNAELTAWKPVGMPRRAGVSAFGIGGTNAHIVLEEAPKVSRESDRFSHQLLTISAKTETALKQATMNLAGHLRANPDVDLADVAWTLQAGRRQFAWRRSIACSSIENAVQQLNNPVSPAEHCPATVLPIVFAFPGQGAQYPGMGQELQAHLPVFSEYMDECAEILRPSLGLDLREAIQSEGVNQTALAQPAIFAMEYALAKQWMSWGIRPQAMVGHSVGEFVAACLAGVFSLSDALLLVAARGRMMQEMPGGVMLSVRAPAEQVSRYLTADLALAAVNSPALCVVSGPESAVATLENSLGGQGIVCRRLRTSHAFHSPMVDPILAPLAERIRKIALHPPQIPYVSTLTGDWITNEQATDANYFARHCRDTVQFSAAVSQLQNEKPWCVLEVGPGQALTTLVRQHGDKPNQLRAVASLPGLAGEQPELVSLLSALGRLWQFGNEPDWNAVHNAQRRNRISLPSYPFERKRYWIDPPQPAIETTREKKHVMAQTEIAPPAAAEIVPVNAGRQDRLLGEVLSMLRELSGLDLNNSASATFLDLGFDSLFLTQVTHSLESKYGVKVRFAQLLNDLSSPQRLAAHLDSVLPVEAVAEPAAPLVAVRAPHAAEPAVMATVPADGLERLLRDQLQAFNDLAARQIEMVKSLTGSVAKVAPAPVAAPVAVAEAGETNCSTFTSFGPYKPLQKNQGAGALTATQRDYLDAFIARYNERTKESKRRTQAHRAVLADPRAVSGFHAEWKDLIYPITVVRSSGSKVYDVDGNEYVDLQNGFGVTMFGHNPPFIREALEKQLDAGIEIGPQTPYAGEVASLVCELTGMERAAFCNTGSEAVMAALRLARTVTNRKKIVYFTGDYHGISDEVLAKATGKSGDVPTCRPIAPGIPMETAANAIVLEYGAPASLETIRAHAHELAAVLVEPVQSRHPDFQPVEFLRELRAITEEAGVALIFDEVVTGFRTHPGGIQALFGVRADLATYGKVMGGGMPIGVVAGKAKFMDALDGGIWEYGDDSIPEAGVTFFAGTFVRHPLAIAAAYAVLNRLKEAGPQLQEELSVRTGRLVQRLNELFEEGGVPARIENFRSIFHFAFPADRHLASLLYYHLLANGVNIREGFCCFLTTAHTDEDIERIVRAFRESIAEMQEGGFLRGKECAHATVAGVMTEAPLTEAQMEIRLAAQLGDEESCAFNEGFSVRLRGHLNVAALRDSLRTAVDRHEALRSTLAESGESQRVLPHVELTMPLVDAGVGGDDWIDAIEDEEARRAFDLIHGPLIRARLIRLSENDHVLFVTAHHIVCDGWSANILLDELSRMYTAKCRGLHVELPVPMRFSEYANDRYCQSIDADVEKYWISEFTEPVPTLELPLDRPRPALKSYRGSTYTTTIDAETTQKIGKAGARCSSTLFNTMLCGFQTLLARLTGQQDIVVGVPAAAQAALAGQTLVGHCANLLPIRLTVASEAKFRDVLVESRRKLVDAFEHQNYTYGTLVRKLAIPRSPSRLPLVEVQFTLIRQGAGPDFGGIDAAVERSPKRFVNFDLFLEIEESAGGLTVHCDYNTDLFDEATVARWLRYYKTLLLAFAGDADQPVSSIPLLNSEDRETILVSWNDTAAVYPRDQCAHQLIEAQAQRTPGAVAVVCGRESVTYRELDRRANRLARALRHRGFARGDRAGIHIDRSIEMVVALLAVWKAGGAYVPLDPSFPAARLAYMADDSGLRVLLTTKALAEDVNTAAEVVLLDDASDIAREDFSPLDLGATADDVAYVIYTSGSTGKPKGVQIQHRALVNLLCAVVKEPGLTANDVLLAVTTISFDIAGLELFAPLLTGARIVLASREQASDGAQLRKLLASSGATVLQATPATWRMLIDSGRNGTPGLKMLCGGEPLSRELADALLERGGELWNMYGPTETTIWSSWCRVQRDGAPITIGAPAANTLFYVLDGNRRPVPPGVAGELCIGGDGVARGYLGCPELTAERFLPNPFAAGRIYRTGDRARFRPDGTVELLGRMDAQVKIRGFRIELGEVEAALAACPEVRNGAVVVREDATGAKVMAGYFVPVQEGAATVEGIRSFLRQRLPDYMVPSCLVPLAALPQTPNGKLDRKALPAPESVRVPTSVDVETPNDPLEAMLIAVWEKVLGYQPIRKTDNFFEIGGHSVLAARLFARMEKTIGKTLPLATLFQAPTVEKLARLLRDSGWTPPWSSLVPIRPGGSKTPFYFVHPIGGNVLNFSGFASHFDADQPIYGLQARGLDGKHAPNTSVAHMAEDYIADIRTVQPEGPYSIGGFSAGGVVAYEMARQLRAQGQKVAVLALLDTPVEITADSGAEGSGWNLARLVRKVRFNALYAFHVGLATFVGYKIRNLRMRARIRVWTIRGSVTGHADPVDLGVEEAFLVALRNYTPAPYEGDATLFRAKDDIASYSDPTLGWGKLVQGRLEIREISGDHDTILHEPHIGMLARVLNSCLHAVQASARGMKTLRQSA